LGIGTDTVNSVRSPASANALVGIRPTHGLITSDGIVPYALCQDTAGPICRTVADAAVTLAIIANGSTSHHLAMYRAAMAEASLGGKRIGIIKPFFGSDSVHTDVNTCMQQSLSVFSQEGAALIDINSLPLSKAHAPAFDGAAEIPLDSHWLIENVSMHLYALQDDLDAYLQAHADAMNVHSISDILAAHLYHPNIGAHLEEAMRYDKASSAYAHRQLRSALVREALLALFQRLNLDALVYPHQQRLVCKTGAHQLNRNGVLSAITGFPAITVPAGFSAPSAEAPIGIPIGIELLGKPWDETALIALAYAFEQQTHFRKAPQLFT
jgi:Asp-tRNA(Asn)/Glu-tRNA(Gln) amidotransferase A subunit family amidase